MDLGGGGGTQIGSALQGEAAEPGPSRSSLSLTAWGVWRSHLSDVQVSLFLHPHSGGLHYTGPAQKCHDFAGYFPHFPEKLLQIRHN